MTNRGCRKREGGREGGRERDVQRVYVCAYIMNQRMDFEVLACFTVDMQLILFL